MFLEVVPQTDPQLFEFGPGAVEEALDDFEDLQPQGRACILIGGGAGNGCLRRRIVPAGVDGLRAGVPDAAIAPEIPGSGGRLVTGHGR